MSEDSRCNDCFSMRHLYELDEHGEPHLLNPEWVWCMQFGFPIANRTHECKYFNRELTEEIPL